MPLVRRLSKASLKRQGPLPWAIALCLFAASLALRVVLASALQGSAFVTFYPAIAAVTLFCGWRQGAVVLTLSALSAWYLFIEPTSSLPLKEAITIDALVGFLLASGFIVAVVGALREAVKRVELAKAVQETLFAELQHRVANNLQLVVAMLRNAERNLPNPVVAAETLNEAEERILAMSQLHRRLHDGTAYADGLEPLLREMVAHSFRNLPVCVRIDVSSVSDLTIDQMTAMTLLVNEAALNAAKHVFSKGLGTRFDVSLSKDQSGRLHLSISDDGPGVSTQATPTETGSLGIGIMEAFAIQLGGSLVIAGGDGTSLSVDFKTR